MSWLRAAHFLGIMLWAGGLLALSRLLWAHAARPTAPAATARMTAVSRRLYRGLALPGLFVVLFTGVWMLHLDHALLKQPFMHAKLTAVALLFVGDHVCLRGIGSLAQGVGSIGPRRFQVVHWGSLALLAGIVVLISVKPWVAA